MMASWVMGMSSMTTSPKMKNDPTKLIDRGRIPKETE